MAQSKKSTAKTPAQPAEVEAYLSYTGRVIELKAALEGREEKPLAMILVQLDVLVAGDVLPIPGTTVELTVDLPEQTVH